MPNTHTPRTAADIEAELLSLPSDSEIDLMQFESQTPAASQTPDPAEAEARRKGWLPKSEYAGDPSKWVDAATFIDRGNKFNKNLQREVETLKQKIADFEGTKAAFKKFHEDTLAKKDAELQAAINALRVQRSQATMDGDHETAIALEDRIEELKTERKAFKEVEVQQPPAAATDNPAGLHVEVLNEWIDDGNTWFREDPKLQAYAVSVGEDLIRNGEKLRGRRFLDKVAEIVAEDFPRKFKQRTTATPASPVASSAAPSRQASAGSRPRTEADLPPEDLKLMRQFIKEGWTTKEKFLAGYFGR